MPDILSFGRRKLLQASAAGLGGLAFGTPTLRAQRGEDQKPKGQPTKFQLACMTLPYSQYPLERALAGIKAAGYQFVAWGTSHKEAGESKGVPVMAADAPPAAAKVLSLRCRDLGLSR